MLLTAYIDRRIFTSALNIIGEVGGWGTRSATRGDLRDCVIIVWKVQCGDVHIHHYATSWKDQPPTMMSEGPEDTWHTFRDSSQGDKMEVSILGFLGC